MAKEGLPNRAKWLFVVALVYGLLLQGTAHGQDGGANSPATTAPAAVSDLVRLLTESPRPRGCTERCYTLSRLVLTGSLEQGNVGFELEGGVLWNGPVAVPLFGPPSGLRIEQARENGHRASIGFEGDHYYLYTSAREFVLRGTLRFQGDAVIQIPGPLNALQSELSDGRVVEGPTLSGLASATVHLDQGNAVQGTTQPPVFQLSRAIRVGREINFEYRLVMRSGSDLSVVRLPLVRGERVLDVAGSTGWRLEGPELILPTAGRNAEITITGNLPLLGSVTPDPRSAYEWVLLESDPEHRVVVRGDARQIDTAESPIPRTQPTARLYLLQRGKHIDTEVQTLVGSEVLAAVVSFHNRHIVLTRNGDLVMDDQISYENNGIDYLSFSPGGRAIYLATDDHAERIMHGPRGATEVLVPLRTGGHSTRVQSLAFLPVARPWGRVALPEATHPPTTSRTSLTLGLPHQVYPVALLGGDQPVWFLDTQDLIALAVAIFLAFFTLRGSLRQAIGALCLGGAWFVAPALYVLAVVAIVGIGAIWLCFKLLRGTPRIVAIVAVVGSTGIAGLIAFGGIFLSRGASESAYRESLSQSVSGSAARNEEGGSGSRRNTSRGTSLAVQQAEGGVLQGVLPVALPLPHFHRSVSTTRELVTRQRPFHPVLVYVTDVFVLSLLGVWLFLLAALGHLHRRPIIAAWQWARRRIAVN